MLVRESEAHYQTPSYVLQRPELSGYSNKSFQT